MKEVSPRPKATRCKLLARPQSKQSDKYNSLSLATKAVKKERQKKKRKEKKESHQRKVTGRGGAHGGVSTYAKW